MNGVVYFVRAGEDGHIKIGFTASKPSERIANLQTGNPVPLILVAVVPGEPILERQLHQRFAQYRGIGEWFKPGSELVAFIDGARLAGGMAAIRRAEDLPSETQLAFGLSGREFKQLVRIVHDEIIEARAYAKAEHAVGADWRDLMFTDGQPDATSEEYAEVQISIAESYPEEYD